MSPLPLIPEIKPLSKKEQFIKEAQERFEHFWKTSPKEKSDPEISAKGSERIERTWALMTEIVSIFPEMRALDLGCGNGAFARRLSNICKEVTALDVANHVIENKDEPGVTYVKGCVPFLKFDEVKYDLILLTDVIAEIDPTLYRLTISEMAMLLSKEGSLICSTPIDLYSEDAASCFMALIKTEFEIQAVKKSFHRFHFYLSRCVEAPKRFLHAAQEPSYRQKQLEKRKYLMRLWFYLNSTTAFSFFWMALAPLFRPFQRILLKNRTLLLFLERISEALWGEAALTHIILIAKKKKLGI